MKKLLLCLLFLLNIARLSLADGDIVFSARYYSPPSRPSEKSYWHLYRINPDGSGKRQITSGVYDDTDPHWSPDGQTIAFLRTRATGVQNRDEGNYSSTALCLLDVGTGKVRVLADYTAHLALTARPWSPQGDQIAALLSRDRSPGVLLLSAGTAKKEAARTEIRNALDFAWSPDGRHGIITTPPPDEIGGRTPPHPDRIFDVRTRQETELPRANQPFVWHSNEMLMQGVIEKLRPAIVFQKIDGSEIKRIPVQISNQGELYDNAPIQAELYPPAPSEAMLFGILGGDSTGGHYQQYWRVDTNSGAAKPFTDGKFLAWSPNGKQFCTLVRRDTTPYGKRKDGSVSTVWTQPLLVGDGVTGKTREIVNGLVFVVGADWRPSRQ